MPILTVSSLTATDRDSWEPLARGYRDFYKTPTTDAEYEATWQRLMAGDRVHGLAARLDGRVVGIAHYLMHASAWVESVCYLQDLFTEPSARGHGVGRTLIDAVAEKARAAGCARYYWLTQDHNATARALYDKLARHHGFLRYDYAL